MQRAMSRLGRLFCLVVMMAAAVRGQSAPATTTVQDILYMANGQPASGSLVITWTDFVTADGKAIAAGNTTVPLGSDGSFSVNLAPNAGATPANSYYAVTVKLTGMATSREAWVVPAASPANLVAVRATVVPATMAMQALTTDWATANLVTLNGTQTIAGAKAFAVSPSTPDPVHATDAANKEYVDANSVGGIDVAKLNVANTWTQAQTALAMNGVQNACLYPNLGAAIAAAKTLGGGKVQVPNGCTINVGNGGVTVGDPATKQPVFLYVEAGGKLQVSATDGGDVFSVCDGSQVYGEFGPDEFSSSHQPSNVTVLATANIGRLFRPCKTDGSQQAWGVMGLNITVQHGAVTGDIIYTTATFVGTRFENNTVTGFTGIGFHAVGQAGIPTSDNYIHNNTFAGDNAGHGRPMVLDGSAGPIGSFFVERVNVENISAGGAGIEVIGDAVGGPNSSTAADIVLTDVRCESGQLNGTADCIRQTNGNNVHISRVYVSDPPTTGCVIDVAQTATGVVRNTVVREVDNPSWTYTMCDGVSQSGSGSYTQAQMPNIAGPYTIDGNGQDNTSYSIAKLPNLMGDTWLQGNFRADNSAAPTDARIYGTDDHAGNSEFLEIGATSGYGPNFSIYSQKSGRGTYRNVHIGSYGAAQIDFDISGATKWYVDGTSYGLRPAADNVVNIGGSASAGRPANIWAGTLMQAPLVNATSGYEVSGVAEIVSVTSDFTTSGTGWQAVPGLSVTLPANTSLNVPLHCYLEYAQSGGTAAVSFGVEDTTEPANAAFQGKIATSTTAMSSGAASGVTTNATASVVTGTPSAVGVVYGAEIEGFVEQGSGAASTLEVMVNTAVAGDAVTVKRGAYCRLF